MECSRFAVLAIFLLSICSDNGINNPPSNRPATNNTMASSISVKPLFFMINYLLYIMTACRQKSDSDYITCCFYSHRIALSRRQRGFDPRWGRHYINSLAVAVTDRMCHMAICGHMRLRNGDKMVTAEIRRRIDVVFQFAPGCAGGLPGYA